MTDRAAGGALLVSIAFGWFFLFQSFSLAAGIAVLALIAAPFAILVTFMVRGGARTSRGWDRPPAEPASKDDEAPEA